MKDRFLALQRRYSVESFPTMFIINSSGVIVDIRVGYNEEKMPFPLADVQRKLGVTVEPLNKPVKDTISETTKKKKEPKKISKKKKKKKKRKRRKNK